MSVPNVVWIIWLVVSGFGFLLLETIGLTDGKRGGTLSEFLWGWLGINRPGYETTRHGRVAVFSGVTGALVGLFAWLLPHILDGWGTAPLLLFLLIGTVVGTAIADRLHARSSVDGSEDSATDA